MVPEGLKIISSKLSTTQSKLIRKFNAISSGCDSNNEINITSRFNYSSTNADFILFVGAVKSDQAFLAKASYCLLGNNDKILIH